MGTTTLARVTWICSGEGHARESHQHTGQQKRRPVTAKYLPLSMQEDVQRYLHSIYISCIQSILRPLSQSSVFTLPISLHARTVTYFAVTTFAKSIHLPTRQVHPPGPLRRPPHPFGHTHTNTAGDRCAKQSGNGFDPHRTCQTDHG